PLLHLHSVPPVRGMEFLDRGDLAIESLCDIDRTELRSVVSTFARPIRPVRRIIICLADGNRREAHLRELGADESSRTIGKFLRGTGWPELVPVGLVMDPRIGVEDDPRFVNSNECEELVSNLIARDLAEFTALVIENQHLF